MVAVEEEAERVVVAGVVDEEAVEAEEDLGVEGWDVVNMVVRKLYKRLPLWTHGYVESILGSCECLLSVLGVHGLPLVLVLVQMR